MKFRHFCTLPDLARHGAPRVLLLLALLAALPLQAAEVTGLYEAGVTVTSRDDERQRQQGFNVAMRAMLLKLTGRADTIENPVVARALSTPQSYVDTWAYNSIVADDPFAVPGQPAQIQLQVTFFQSGIQQMLSEAGIAVWPQNRPDTLLWVVIQDELGERFMAAPPADQGGDLLVALQKVAEKRGVPLLLPLLDFADIRALPIESLWNFDINALRIASGRYQSESILALRVFRSLSGDVIGKAVYIFRDRVLELEALESPLEPFLEGSIDLAAQELASRYAILLSSGGVDTSAEVLLTVEGIGNAADYAGLLQYLNGLAVVSGVQVISAEGASVQLKLRTGGQLPQLIESIALDRRLTALGQVARDGPQVLMHYQWSRQP